MNDDSSTLSPRLERWIAAALLGLYLVFALSFSAAPIFEGAEEIEHYRFVRYMTADSRLPNPFEQRGEQLHQAPLYYFLTAPIMLLVDDPDFERIDAAINPFTGAAISVRGNDNKNYHLHSRSEVFPYTGSGTALAAHLMRLVSVALGLGTLLAAYGIFRVLWPQRPDLRLAALGFTAFMPHFVQVSATINNDVVLWFTLTLSLWLVLRQQRDGWTWRGSVALGAALGLALLSKVNAAFLVFPVGAAVLMDLRRSWKHAVLILTVVTLVAGWWYIRNLALYGDPTGMRALFEASQPNEAIRQGALAPEIGLRRLPFAYATFWAGFADGRVMPGRGIATFFDVLTGLMLAGLGVWVLKAVRRVRQGAVERAAVRQAVMLAIFGVAWLLALLYYASRAWNGAQGRYLVGGVAVWAVVFALAVDAFSPRRLRLPVALGGAAVLGIVTGVALYGYFLPSFRVLPAPQQVDVPLSIRYGDLAELVGMSPAAPHARPGETIAIELVWRALRPSDAPLQVYLHSLDSDMVRRDSHPATGNLLSTEWQPGQMWAERYVIVIPEDAEPQRVYPLVAGLYDPAADVALAALDAGGSPITPIIGRIAINGPFGEIAPAYRFGDLFELAKPQVQISGDDLEVCLQWRSLKTAAVDYQMFIHVLGPDGQPVVQHDGPPRGGLYPTGTWLPGEVIDDCVTLNVAGLPSQGWRVALGLYNLADGARLPAATAVGDPLPDGMVLIEP
ncbi:MAG: hypothetical protein Kow00124_26720 [Anaerolineae bacterium]